MKAIVFTAALVMAGISIYFIFSLFSDTSTSDQGFVDSDVAGQGGDTFFTPPSSGTDGPVREDGSPEGQQSSTMMLETRYGDTIEVSNVQKEAYALGDGKTYAIAGGLNEENAEYALTYYAEDDFFQVNLRTEPLAEVRKDAEQHLMRALGIDEGTLCQLNASVRTGIYVNQFYAGQELGFSFCPRSVPLE